MFQFIHTTGQVSDVAYIYGSEKIIRLSITEAIAVNPSPVIDGLRA